MTVREVTPLTLCDEPVNYIGDDTYTVTFPSPLNETTAIWLQAIWREHFGDKKRLVILDRGASVARFGRPEPTPIYDALVVERGCGK